METEGIVIASLAKRILEAGITDSNSKAIKLARKALTSEEVAQAVVAVAKSLCYIGDWWVEHE